MGITAIAYDGRLTYIDLRAVFVFLYICAASIGAYVLWTALLKNGSPSGLSVIKFTEPLFAVLFSAILLGEHIFRVAYLMALLPIVAVPTVEYFPRRSYDCNDF